MAWLGDLDTDSCCGKVLEYVLGYGNVGSGTDYEHESVEPTCALQQVRDHQSPARAHELRRRQLDDSSFLHAATSFKKLELIFFPEIWYKESVIREDSDVPVGQIALVCLWARSSSTHIPTALIISKRWRKHTVAWDKRRPPF